MLREARERLRDHRAARPPSDRSLPPSARRGRALPGWPALQAVRGGLPGRAARVLPVYRRGAVRGDPAVAQGDALGLVDRAPVHARGPGAVRGRRRRPARGRVGALEPDRRRARSRAAPLRHAGRDDDRRLPAGPGRQRRGRLLLPPRSGLGASAMRDVYVAGVAMIRFGRYPERDVPDLGAEAVLLALKDAGLSIKDVELMAAGCLFQANAMGGQRVLQEIGQTGIPVVNVANACATGSTAFREAWMAVASGEYDVALAVGVEQMGKMGLLTGGGGGSGIRTEGVIGSGLMPAVFGQAGMEHMRRYGTTQEQFAKVAVKNHKHSTKNPLSQYQNEVGLEDVLKARMVAYPNTLYMCCPTGDGAAAAVVLSPEKARQLGARVRVLASVLTSDPWTERDLTLPDVSTLTRNAARKAYELAGIGPEDLDLVELHDCFATAELLHYENLGLCKDGEAGRMIDEGETAHGGRIPVNVSGGLLSTGQ